METPTGDGDGLGKSSNVGDVGDGSREEWAGARMATDFFCWEEGDL